MYFNLEFTELHRRNNISVNEHREKQKQGTWLRYTCIQKKRFHTRDFPLLSVKIVYGSRSMSQNWYQLFWILCPQNKLLFKVLCGHSFTSFTLFLLSLQLILYTITRPMVTPVDLVLRWSLRHSLRHLIWNPNSETPCPFYPFNRWLKSLSSQFSTGSP